MNSPHPYKLRPYHNPENVDESKVPPGWRFRYADEMTKAARTACHAWTPGCGFDWNCTYFGTHRRITYIVPVVS